MDNSHRAAAGLNFTAIDFETANRSRSSVCAVGAVRVRDGVVVDRFRSLVAPPAGEDHFEDANTRTHGLAAADVAEAPPWNELYPDFMRFVDGDLLTGHNIRFDVSVLLNANGMYDIPWPELPTLCTLQLSRAMLRLPSYALPWVGRHLDLGYFDHHDPLANAEMSAAVVIELARRQGVTSAIELAQRLNVPVAPTFVDDSDHVMGALGSSPDPLIATGFEGEAVCFTGALKLMPRADAQQLVVEHGGVKQSGVNKKTTILVTGDFDSRTFKPGAIFSAKLQKAFDLAEAGQPLEIITEDDFIARLSLSEEALRNRVASTAGRRRRLPDWVTSQAREAPSEDYWQWFCAALAHPDGRAVEGDTCIWCDGRIRGNAHWIHRDRHVCGVHCNERLKRSAKSAWAREGIRTPEPSDDWSY